jgi:hypothetical protein
VTANPLAKVDGNLLEGDQLNHPPSLTDENVNVAWSRPDSSGSELKLTLPQILPQPPETDRTTFRGIVQADAELNFQWAATLIDAFVEAGAEHAVMSPGAQMAPLSLACRANDKLKITIIIDERSAAFFALGLARLTRKPTILICTSGSAVGQWYPAVMEASAGLTPLILLTADRAPENQDRCSAQAIDQIRVFGPHVRASHHLPLPDASIDSLLPLSSRIYEQSLWPAPGPVHVNLPFRDPLIPKTRNKRPVPRPPLIAPSIVRPQLEDILSAAEVISGRPGAIIVGSTEIDDADGFSGAVQDLARHGLPDHCRSVEPFAFRCAQGRSGHGPCRQFSAIQGVRRHSPPRMDHQFRRTADLQDRADLDAGFAVHGLYHCRSQRTLARPGRAGNPSAAFQSGILLSRIDRSRRHQACAGRLGG